MVMIFGLTHNAITCLGKETASGVQVFGFDRMMLFIQLKKALGDCVVCTNMASLLVASDLPFVFVLQRGAETEPRAKARAKLELTAREML